MSDSLDDRHATSDEYNDPWCDPCFDARGRNVRVYGYCKDCYQFLCTDWSHHAQQTPGGQGSCHSTRRGYASVSVSKPPRFDLCEVHPKLLKEKFCSVHKSVLCASCSSSNHKRCPVKSVEDTCKNIQISEIDALYDAISGYKDTWKSVMSSVETNISKIKEERKMILKETQSTYDQIISKVNKLFREIEKAMEATYQSQLTILSQHQKTINDVILRVEVSASDLDQLKGKTVDTKLFLRIQEIVNNTKQYANDLKYQNQSLRTISLSFELDDNIRDFLVSSFNFGSVSVSEGRPDRTISVPEIIFPLYSLQQSPTMPRAIKQQSSGHSQVGTRSQPTRSAVPLSAIKATKQQSSGRSQAAAESQPTRSVVPVSAIKAYKRGSYNTEIKNGTASCDIACMAITKDGRRLMVDYNNDNVKLFSQDMKFLSSVSVSGSMDIAVLSDQEAAVGGNSLVILDISGRQLCIKHTIQTPYHIRGIIKHTDKLVVTCPYTNPPSVKLIDKTGRVDWSVSSDQQGQPLFRYPFYVSSPGGGRSSSVIVSDYSNNTLTLLNGETGDVITGRQVKGKISNGVTTDTAGNFYVCYCLTSEVAVLSGDLTEETILLSRQNGLGEKPRAIFCDDTALQLLISYYGSSSIDYFQLSY